MKNTLLFSVLIFNGIGIFCGFISMTSYHTCTYKNLLAVTNLGYRVGCELMKERF